MSEFYRCCQPVEVPILNIMGWCQEEVGSQSPSHISDTVASDEHAHGRVGQSRLRLCQRGNYTALNPEKQCAVPAPYPNSDKMVALSCMLL
jgi:hypothetical protein